MTAGTVMLFALAVLTDGWLDLLHMWLFFAGLNHLRLNRGNLQDIR
jgi:hypothetical protein